MKGKYGLRSKIIIIFLVFMMVLSGFTIYVLRDSYESIIIEKYYNQALSIARLASSILDGDRIQFYAENVSEETVQTAEYQLDKQRLDNIKKQSEAYYLYVMYPIDSEKGIYIFDAELTDEQVELIEAQEAVLGYEVVFGNDFPSAMKSLETGEISKELDITTTMQGHLEQTLASLYAPIFNGEGETVAFVGVDINMTDVETYINTTSVQVIQIIVFITLVCFAILMWIIQFSILRPVKALNKAAQDLMRGKYGEQIDVIGNDEISEITRVFNEMSVNIGNHMNEIQTINDAYHRYIPSMFFDLLKKECVTDAKLGDQKQHNLTILHCDVTGFASIIRTMSAEEMYSFVNDLLQHVIPHVVNTEGMIENFHNGGFNALYPDSCNKAVSAAVSICQKINYLNKKKGLGIKENVNFAVGLSYGSVMLGIVGHDTRLAALSISQQTEIAVFLQKLAPKYYARILITGALTDQIEQFFHRYHARFLGYLLNTSTNQMEKIYDVYDGDEEEDRRLKEITQPVFEEGVNLYCSRKFYEARNCFVEVLKQFRRDTASRKYLYLCNQYYQREEDTEIEICVEKF